MTDKHLLMLMALTLFASGCSPEVKLVFGESDAGNPCGDGGDCHCVDIGVKSCDPNNPLVELTCQVVPEPDAGISDGGISDAGEPLDAGNNAEAGAGPSGTIQVIPCPMKSSCVEGLGCQPCVDSCDSLGKLICAGDMQAILACLPDGPAQCLALVPQLNCAEANLSVCDPPPGNVADAGPIDYCVNECGGRGVPLEHSLCSPHPDIPCAFWVCDSTTQGLKPDHESCFQSGMACSNDAQCKSCACINGLCMGSTSKSCFAACN